jgi:hypothetical protein
MGIEKLGHIQKRLDKEKKRENAKKELKQVGKGVAFGGALLAVGAVGAGVAIDHLKLKPDTPAILLKFAEDKKRIPVEEFIAAKKMLPDKLVLSVALLAHSRVPRYGEFDTDIALQDADKIGKGLVIPLVRHKKVDEAYWADLSEELRSNDNSTADVRIDLLKDVSSKYGGVEPIELEESIAYVARNLYFKQQQPSAENVRTEVQSILERRNALAQENIFDRDTLLVSADETWHTGTSADRRFGTKTLEDALKRRQHAANPEARFSHVTPLSYDASGFHSTPESISNAKQETLNIIAHSTKPLTVFFDGHGGGGSFYLSGSVGTKEESIDFNEMADALTQRWGMKMTQSSRAKELDISFVFDDCEMQMFARYLAQILSYRHIPLPHVMITSSEWEQYGFSNKMNDYGSTFNELMVRQKDLGAVMEHKHDIKDSDPSIFTPRNDDPQKLMQVSGIVLPTDSASA